MNVDDDLRSSLSQLARSFGNDINEIVNRIDTLMQCEDFFPVLLNYISQSSETTRKYALFVLKRSLILMKDRVTPETLETITEIIINTVTVSEYETVNYSMSILGLFIDEIIESDLLGRYCLQFYQNNNLYIVSFLAKFLNFSRHEDIMTDIISSGFVHNNIIINQNTFSILINIVDFYKNQELNYDITQYKQSLIQRLQDLINNKLSKDYNSICQLLIATRDDLLDMVDFYDLYPLISQVFSDDFDKEMKEVSLDLLGKLVITSTINLTQENTLELLNLSLNETSNLYSPEEDYLNQTIECLQQLSLSLFKLIGFEQTLQFIVEKFNNFNQLKENQIIALMLYTNAAVDAFPAVVGIFDELFIILINLVQIENENIRYYTLDLINNVLMSGVEFEEQQWSNFANFFFQFAMDTNNEFAAQSLVIIIKKNPKCINFEQFAENLLIYEITKSSLMILTNLIAYKADEAQQYASDLYSYATEIIKEVDIINGSSILFSLIAAIPYSLVENIQDIIDFTLQQMHEDDTDYLFNSLSLYQIIVMNYKDSLFGETDFVETSLNEIISDLLERSSSNDEFVVHTYLMQMQLEVISSILPYFTKILEYFPDTFNNLMQIVNNCITNEILLPVISDLLSFMIKISFDPKIVNDLISNSLEKFEEQDLNNFEYICDNFCQILESNLISPEFRYNLLVILVDKMIKLSNTSCEPSRKITTLISNILSSLSDENLLKAHKLISNAMSTMIDSTEEKLSVYFLVFSKLTHLSIFENKIFERGIEKAIPSIEFRSISSKFAIPFVLGTIINKRFPINLANEVWNLFVVVDSYNDQQRDEILFASFLLTDSNQNIPNDSLIVMLNSLPPRVSNNMYNILSYLLLKLQISDELRIPYNLALYRFLTYLEPSILMKLVKINIISLLIQRFNETFSKDQYDEEHIIKINKIIEFFHKCEQNINTCL
ncbi:hypothetical protein TVAG_458820 [Trichomonas vaginalis G3]|uniref:Uncharacterized protein n=1 Tax=Trichomonas vaginalis (strain ATCC PRA-98 / G3) TaxID=412133 RepID=A2E687_TRIV3|nr:armadillo (ARM) repeat-containing protein family [Trichomonas vaginalis G3]EAY11810.1 hypothetical protein TVAG_458820 [Trichomonas vaginalis G3]KAI5534216.1 armadillo (ARM) repeat-containing protein family [Trichomonas vaginalis G3]|eukprot:XP_001324033.1 hypothetical protein [Trichomonas vaginalis G3]